MMAQLDKATKTKSIRKTKSSRLEDLFVERWLEYAPDAPAPTTQVHFDFDYNGRFDFAWIHQMVALEIQGGTFVRGAHVRGMGYSDDCKKLNSATLKGWRMFQATTDMLRPDKETGQILVIDQIRSALHHYVDAEAQWVAWIRDLQIGDSIIEHGFFVERVSQAKYRVNDREIRGKNTRDTWQQALNAIMYYPLTEEEIWLRKQQSK
jgi:hypothetical protein